MALLHDEGIDTLLAGTEWRKDGASIVRELEFPDFRAAIAFVNRVAEDAERAGHHPDILIHSYRKVQIRLTTHTDGGVTMNDIELSRTIDAVV